MSNVPEQSFYLQHIPQSEYRRIVSQDAPERQVMDIGLSHLGIQDPELKQQLVEKIRLESDHFLRVLMTESACEKLIKSAYIDSLLAALGLL